MRTAAAALSIFLSAGYLAGQQPESFLVQISLGHGRPVEFWNGSIATASAQVDQFEGWRLLADHRIALNTFQITAGDEALRGLLLRGRSGPEGKVSISTNRGNFSFRPVDLVVGQPRSFLHGAARAERLLDADKLTDDSRDDDYPSIAVADENTAWAVWQSYSGRFDEIRLSKFENGGWKTFTRLPNVSGDVWRPQVAVDAEDRPWVVWSQQLDGNFDIYARALDEKANRWLPAVRLSSHPSPDFDHHLIADSEKRLWVVWQGFRGNDSEIFLRRYEDEQWSGEIQVSQDPANDWEPRIAVDRGGTAHIVWDSYRKGSYDVYLRRYQGGKLGPTIAVAATPKFEAHATVAADPSGRVWVAWDESGWNWAKDHGPTVDPGWREKTPGEALRGPGTRIYESRNLNLAVFEGEQRKTTLQDVQQAAAAGGGDAHDVPQLHIDGESGRVALLFHRRNLTEARGSGGRRFGYWDWGVMFYEGDAWQAPAALPHSLGRSSARAAATFSAGDLWLIWPTDEREWVNTHQPKVNNIYTARLTTPQPFRPALLNTAPAEDGSPANPSIAISHPNERQDVERIRAYRTFVDGVEQRIVRGDFHRHTELSWDGGGRTDGSLFDFYRYMIDAAAMDFGAVTDHNAGGDNEYWWWLTEKSSDLFHLPRVFTTFYAYERSAVFPDGHRNVFHTRRGVPVVSFFTEATYGGARPGVASGDLVLNDTQLLYESLRRTGGIAISHTSTSNTMGTDWRDNDPEVEPVVEIFQGARVSSEHLGGPRAARGPEDRPPGGFQEAGFLWNAYSKGYRLGTITSSDHNSTHISYAMIYTPEPTREAIFGAIRKRHTYGATDNIILDFRMGAHFMGAEFKTSSVPPLRIKAVGTSRIERLEIIKNAALVYSTEPGSREIEITYQDQDTTPGRRYYYVRIIQDDRQIAWSSPIWVDYAQP